MICEPLVAEAGKQCGFVVEKNSCLCAVEAFGIGAAVVVVVEQENSFEIVLALEPLIGLVIVYEHCRYPMWLLRSSRLP